MVGATAAPVKLSVALLRDRWRATARLDRRGRRIHV